MTRLRITFIVLTVAATIAMASLMIALGRQPGPIVGTTVAVSGLALVAALGLGLRMLLVADRARQRSRLNVNQGGM